MIDWNAVAKIAGGGFGVTIFVLIVLALVSWIVGMAIQRSKRKKGSEEEKGG